MPCILPAVSGNNVSEWHAGLCRLTADQLGNADYEEADTVTAEVLSTPKANTITNFNPATPIVYTSGTPAVCTVSVNAINVQAAGTCTLAASQTADAYCGAAGATAEVVITKAMQSISFDAIRNCRLDEQSVVASATAAPYSVTWANVAAGTYAVSAKATDNQGLSTTSSAVTFIVNAPPTIAITSPANNSTIAAPANVSITTNAQDSDGTLSKVDYYQGGVLIGTVTAAPYTFSWTNVAQGSYVLTAIATDNYGAQATSAAIAITVAPPAAKVYYVHADHLGTPRAITRPSDNAVVWRWDNTDPFGKNLPSEDPGNTGTAFKYNNRFRGQYYDAETGTFYNWHRTYNPDLGGYTTSDPLGLAGGINTYSYVGGNPLTHIDPHGLTCQSNWDFFWDWWLERGASKRSYKGSDVENKEMQNSTPAQYMRNVFKAGGCKDVQIKGYGTIRAYFETFTSPCSTEFQVGGFVWSAINVDKCNVRYRVYNQASLYSFFFHIPGIPHKPRSSDGGGYGGNIDQVFEWTELSPCAEPECCNKGS
jgi:RHS repeat-associated protein